MDLVFLYSATEACIVSYAFEIFKLTCWMPDEYKIKLLAILCCNSLVNGGRGGGAQVGITFIFITADHTKSHRGLLSCSNAAAAAAS